MMEKIIIVVSEQVYYVAKKQKPSLETCLQGRSVFVLALASQIVSHFIDTPPAPVTSS